MKIAIVGPSHPYRGGIVQATTELAHRMSAAGHDVTLVAWKAQYPKRLYPGDLLPDDQPELPPFPDTRRLLSWYDPLSWWRASRLLSGYELVIFVWYVPTLQGPIYNRILGRLKGPRTAVICHNVLPHEGRPGDHMFAQRVLGAVDHLIVHTPEQAALAKELSRSPITVTELPPLLPGWSSSTAKHSNAVYHHLLFFGIVRDYKGLDVLLRGIALVPNIKLTVAGEFWGGSAAYETLITELGIADRVELRSGYLSSFEIPQLFAKNDALVLPYRSATGTTNVRLGYAYGIPVISSDVPALASQIENGKTGLVFKSGDYMALAAAIKNLYSGNVLATLRSSLPIVPVDASWDEYLQVLLGNETV